MQNSQSMLQHSNEATEQDSRLHVGSMMMRENSSGNVGNRVKFIEPKSACQAKDNEMIQSGESSQTLMSFMDINQYENNVQQFNQDISTQINQNNLQSKTCLDDRIYITLDNKVHYVDSIVQMKKTQTGLAMFRLAMCCSCCKSRFYWFNKQKIIEFGCSQLSNLAAQFEDFYKEGIDIQSQKTNEQLDYEIDDEIYDELDKFYGDGQSSIWDHNNKQAIVQHLDLNSMCKYQQKSCIDNRNIFDLNMNNKKNNQHDDLFKTNQFNEETNIKHQFKSDCQSEISIGAIHQYIQNKDNKKDLKPSKKRTFNDLVCEDFNNQKIDREDESIDEIMSIATNNSESGQSDFCQVNKMSQIQQSLYFSKVQKPFQIKRKINKPVNQQQYEQQVVRKMKLNESGENHNDMNDINQQIYLNQNTNNLSEGKMVGLNNQQSSCLQLNQQSSLIFNQLNDQETSTIQSSEVLGGQSCCVDIQQQNYGRRLQKQ